MSVYEFCVICEEQLLDNEKDFNKEYENVNFPICHICLSNGVNEIEKVIGKQNE